ncbi:MAG: hypothetical protein ACE5WD_09935, partial [Candidatus Aminicenantia bacterium]
LDFGFFDKYNNCFGHLVIWSLGFGVLIFVEVEPRKEIIRGEANPKYSGENLHHSWVFKVENAHYYKGVNRAKAKNLPFNKREFRFETTLKIFD